MLIKTQTDSCQYLVCGISSDARQVDFTLTDFSYNDLLNAVPSNLFLNKIGKPALYLPTCMVIWGTISALTAACQSYGGLIACRFMLGFIEAAYFVSQSHLY